jgi:hypothetical protein
MSLVWCPRLNLRINAQSFHAPLLPSATNVLSLSSLLSLSFRFPSDLEILVCYFK